MARKPVARKKPTKAAIKAAADRAEKRAKGEKVEPETGVLNPPETARPRGRPTKYDPAFCDQVIALGEQGKSRTQIARTLGTTRKTLLEWENAHAEFRNAMSIAEEYAMAWWEDVGQVGVTAGKSFNSHAYAFQMKNRFHKYYRDKQDVGLSADGSFLKVWQLLGSGVTAKEERP